MTLTLEYKFPLIPMNNAYTNNRFGGRVLTKEAREFKTLVEYMTRKQFGGGRCPVDIEKHWVEASYVIYSPKILTKAGRINKNKGDEDGQIKLLQDSICKALGFDDCMITESHRKQIHSEIHLTMVTFNVYGLMSLNDLRF